MPDHFEPERYELFAASPYRFELERRDFFAVLGGGILIFLPTGESEAQESGRGRRSGFGRRLPQQIDAWLHVAEDGKVTVYTGKAEMGQNIRTSLTQAVSEELHAPISSIRLVMGDTDRTPFDMGTFGSRTTPTMAPQLRKAAKAARDLLIQLAAKRWKVDRGVLRVAEGKVTRTDTSQSLSFGELTRGQKLAGSIGPESPSVPVGKSVPKIDGSAFVTGRHRYPSDQRRPGMLYGRILRPVSFQATLTSFDAGAVKDIPGVVVVHDGDFAGVAASTPQLADRALAALRAEWKPVPQPSGRELFEYLKEHAQEGRGDSRGSMRRGLDESDKKLSATYTVGYIAHAPLEPRAALAEWNGGRLTVWTGSQRPFGVREQLAEAFGIPEERVRVIIPDTGSAYGGKHTGETAIEAARLAKAAGKPVKLVWTREEEFTWAYFRPAGVIEIASGVRKDGVVTAWEFHNYNSGGSAIETPYDVPNQRIEFHPTQSPLRQGSYRGLAATANFFARESHMDELAHAVGLDPLEFRLKNLKNPRIRAVLEAAAERFGWGKAKPAPGHGYGLACGTEKGSCVATCAEVAVEPSSKRVKILRVVEAFECGAIVNPNQLENQIQGAISMGIGGALWEAIQFQDGKILNPRFSRYRVPRFADMPNIDVVLVDRKDLPSAGAGETPIMGIAPAVGNAIFHATGVRRRSLPMT